MADASTTPSGLARDAAGNLADMPRDMVHSISHELFNVLTLLRSTMHEVEAIGTERDEDPDGLTSADGRATSLLGMAGDKVRAMLDIINPYV